MAIRKIEKIYCSLNLGYIYNVNYLYTPESGIRISLFFVNESGIYKKPKLNTKTQIKIGNAVFNMYSTRFEESGGSGGKTCKVDFVDDTFKLDNYYIGLTGRACGSGVFQLGTVVDKRTDAEKDKEDPDLFKIKSFTSFEDVEYSFQDFINVLKSVFPIEIKPKIDASITRPFTGTFRDVLSAWCSYFNYSFFFENGKLIIFDPTSLNITFPAIPADAVDYSISESIENTYDKTAWVNFSQDGGEVTIGTTDTDNIFITNETLYPCDSIFDIKTLNDGIYGAISKDQLVAAQYGKEFWLLYNYSKGTEKEICGLNRYASFPGVFLLDGLATRKDQITQSLGANKDIAFFDEKLFNENYEFYYNYGREIAGRYYASNPKLGFDAFNLYQWFDQNEITSTTLEGLRQQPTIRPDYFSRPSGADYGFVNGTSFGGKYKGLACNSQRIYVKDSLDKNFELFFALTELQLQEAGAAFKKLSGGDFGSGFVQWGDGTQKAYIIYETISVPTVILSIIETIKDKESFFDPRYSNFQMKGYFNRELPNEPEANQVFDDTDIQIIGGGPNINSNTSIIKAKKDSDYVAYYAKYTNCDSVSTSAGALNRRFEPIQPSIDIAIPIEITKNSKGVVRIDRDLSYVNKYKESKILDKIAQSFTIPEKRQSFTLNYFYQGIPVSFISNGLVGLSISITEGALSASYSYSNEMLRVPISQQLIDKLEQVVKSSWIRTYIPRKNKSI